MDDEVYRASRGRSPDPASDPEMADRPVLNPVVPLKSDMPMWVSWQASRTVTVQQVHEVNGVTTRIWMNDGTVWESDDSSAPLLASGDEIRYEHAPNWPSLVPDSPSEYPNRSTLGTDEGCYLIDKSRAGLAKLFAFRVVGDPKKESCPPSDFQRTSN